MTPKDVKDNSLTGADLRKGSLTAIDDQASPYDFTVYVTCTF